jgi:hypothetical protein
MLSEDIAEKTENLVEGIAVRVGEISKDALRSAITKLLDEINRKDKPKSEKIKYGRTTLTKLDEQHGERTSIDLKNPDLRMLNSFMKKEGVRFAATKDVKGMYTLYFKGKDVEKTTKALEKYSRKLIKLGKNTPSIKQSLTLARQLSQTLNNNRNVEKNRNRGGLER